MMKDVDIVRILDDGGIYQWGLPIAKPMLPWKGRVDWRDDGKASSLRYIVPLPVFQDSRFLKSWTRMRFKSWE